MNTSILVKSFHYLRSSDKIVSLSSGIYQHLSELNYTDNKLTDSLDKEDFEVAESIIHLNNNIDTLNNLLCKSFDNEHHEQVYRRIKILLKASANANILNELSRNSFDNRTEEQAYQRIKILLEAGADVHFSEDALLRRASRICSVKIIRLLISYGADVHADYASALWQAIIFDNKEIVKVLITEAGADPLVNIDTVYYEPLSGTCYDGHTEIVKVLLKTRIYTQDNIDNALISACHGGYPDIVKLLIDTGANVHAVNGKTLKRVIKNNNTDIIDMLKINTIK